MKMTNQNRKFLLTALAAIACALLPALVSAGGGGGSAGDRQSGATGTASESGPGFNFIRGDLNGDGDVTSADVDALWDYLFSGATLTVCVHAADIDNSGEATLVDWTLLEDFVNHGGATPPAAPYPNPGVDPDGQSCSVDIYGDPGADEDGDGVANGADNCPFTPNADQADADNDGVGDVCDPVNDNDPPGVFIRGDVNADGVVDGADSDGLWDYLFSGGALAACAVAADVNNDGEVNVVDWTHLESFFAGAGEAPAQPYPSCGEDPEGDYCGAASFCGGSQGLAIGDPGKGADPSATQLNGTGQDLSYLKSNYPNPFNPSTIIKLELPTAAKWRVDVFNVLGERVSSFEGFDGAGEVNVEFNAEGSPSGIYFYRSLVLGKVESRKMILLK